MKPQIYLALAVLLSLGSGGPLPAQEPDNERPARPGLVYSDIPVIHTVVETAVPMPKRNESSWRPKQPPKEKNKYPWQIEHRNRLVPSDPDVDPLSIVPTGPPTEPKTQSGPIAADGDFVFYKDVMLSDTDTGNPGSWPREPSVGTFGRVTLYTGNTFGAVSDDVAGTWTNISPDDMLGVTNVCCDQVVAYDRRHTSWIWLIQSDKNASQENVYYLAAFEGQKNMTNLSGFYYTLDPQNYGFASGVWWDFPDMTVSNNYVWFVCDGVNDGDSIVVRAELNDFLNGGTTTFQYAHLNVWAPRLIQAADTTVMYLASHVDNNTMRIYRWPESGSIDGVDRNVTAWNNGNNSAPGPDGRDWFGSNTPGDAGHYPLGGTATGSTLYFMWTASQGGGYPYPHLQIGEFTRDSNRDYVQSEVVWSSNTAWAYASASANDRGHIAGTINYGGGSYYPSTAAWIGDDYNSVDLQPLENLVIESGNFGPSPSGRWGDYLTSRRHVPYFYTWVGTGFTLEQGSSWNSDRCTYTWFGRERDRPPTYHSIYVDLSNTTGWESGNDSHPFNTVDEGHFATMPGDTVYVQAGTYTEHITMNRACYIKAQGGSVIIK